ncbi:MAG: hypothetical protein KDB11_33495 [Planctomycetales bacterium]|nr:hypothetical protein [Planctomycetales bacterium]
MKDVLRVIEDDAIAACPNLSRLRMSPGDLRSLARQGFVSEDKRGSDRVYFKLRYRCPETMRQRVRYIGADRQVADAVRRELRTLQERTRAAAELNRLEVEARRMLRRTKQQLAPLLEQEQLHFYGLEIRKYRFANTERTTRDATDQQIATLKTGVSNDER